jgi:hypothetical protein
MQTSTTKKTFLQLIAALNAAKQYPRRHDYVYRATNGRTESTKEVTEREAGIIITELQTRFGIKDEADTMRKKIISLAHQMFWELPGGKADMKRINNWCVDKGPYKKTLNTHTVKELPVLVSVFEKIYKEYMNKL